MDAVRALAEGLGAGLRAEMRLRGNGYGGRRWSYETGVEFDGAGGVQEERLGRDEAPYVGKWRGGGRDVAVWAVSCDLVIWFEWTCGSEVLVTVCVLPTGVDTIPPGWDGAWLPVHGPQMSKISLQAKGQMIPVQEEGPERSASIEVLHSKVIGESPLGRQCCQRDDVKHRVGCG